MNTVSLPRIKLPIPYRLKPRRFLKVYLPDELGYPLNTREPDVQKELVRRLDDYYTFFDVGAHIGTYSILASASDDIKIYAFEPHPDNIQRLRENVGLNKVSNRIKIIPSAVSDSEGKSELFLGKSGDSHSMLPIYHNNDKRCKTVYTTTLDQFCERQTISPDLIKIDAEGAGDLVLKGASEVINKHPDFLLETHSDNEENGFHSILEPNGYNIVRLSENHLFATAD